jgi:cardiolipin synthase
MFKTESTKPILEQTAELKDQLKASVTQNVTHENIYNLPNFLTFTRLVAAPVVGYLVLHDQHALAASLFIYAGVTDLVDGWIARKWKLQTVVGSVVDPMADKLLMTILTVCLAVKGALPSTSCDNERQMRN